MQIPFRYSILPVACLALVLSSSAFAQTVPGGPTGPTPPSGGTGGTGGPTAGGPAPTAPSTGCDSVHPSLTVFDPPYGPRCTGPYDSNQICANNPSVGGNFNWYTVVVTPGVNTNIVMTYFSSGSTPLSVSAITSNNLHCSDTENPYNYVPPGGSMPGGR
jgi:hypothetical protein